MISLTSLVRPFQCWPSTAPEATWAEDFPANEEWAYCLGIALVVLGIPRLLRTNMFSVYIDESTVCIS